MKSNRFNLPLVVALAAALSASPALAQGNGKGRGNDDDDRRRVEQRDRDRDRDRDWDDDDDDDRRWDRRNDTRFERRVPPGWCRGRGNPHNTAANCRWNSNRSVWERYDPRDRRWETQSTWERGSNDRYDDRYGDRGSYDAAHRDFHYSHDRQCRERAAQRPLDLAYQVRVRQECRAIHEDFHRRWGISH
ncbi:MAG TPA: hypothetical protein VHG08_22860 [Longimicrobium sp.]|nr:hypothetical protein [Longimicrobium sp.]